MATIWFTRQALWVKPEIYKNKNFYKVKEYLRRGTKRKMMDGSASLLSMKRQSELKKLGRGKKNTTYRNKRIR